MNPPPPKTRFTHESKTFLFVAEAPRRESANQMFHVNNHAAAGPIWTTRG